MSNTTSSSTTTTTTSFDHFRKTALSKLDKSPKGSIDTPILPILSLVNSHPNWISTSSCSGRIAVYAPGHPIGDAQQGVEGGDDGDTEGRGEGVDGDEGRSVARPVKTVNGKGAGRWLFVSHSTLTPAQLMSPTQTIFSDSVVVPHNNNAVHDHTNLSVPSIHLKYEAPVLHLASRTVETALPLLRASLAAGFRNSGLVLGGSGKVILAVRMAPGGLDVPIAHSRMSTDTATQYFLEVPEPYLSTILHKAHRLMELNAEKLLRLEAEFRSALEGKAYSGVEKPPESWEPADDRRERKRREGLERQAAVKAAAEKRSEEEDGTS